ncbi:AsmA family protein [Magnetovibrio sp.]|uniref:AsmA family protein n=1 Tax=Magnetovibrio sp. TaxID=2024836 RepID=UPI002F95073B
MKTTLKIVGALMVLMIATVVALVSVLLSLDYGRYKADLDKMVQDATGREFTIAGDLDLALSLTPKLTVTDVTLANAGWGRDVPMMTFKRLDAQVALRPLLSGRLEIDFIELDGVNLVLQTDGAGKANWEFPTLSQQPAGAEVQGVGQELKLTPSVSAVRLRNVHVTYIDGATGVELETDLKRADFTAESVDSPLKGDIEAVFNGVAVEGRAELGSLGLLIATEGAAFPVNLKLSAEDLSADIVGTVDQPSAGMAINARVHAQAPNSATLSKLAGVELPDVGAIDVRANVSGAGTAFTFKGLEATLGNSDVKGDAEVKLSGARPSVTAKLSSDFLDVNQLAGLSVERKDDDAPLSRVFTTEPLPFEVLKTTDADVRYSAKRLRVDAVSLTSLNAVAKLNGGTLRVAPLQFTFDEGRVSARMSVDSGRETPEVTVRASLRSLDAGTFLAMAGQGRIVSLKLDGEVNLQSAGATTQTLAAALNGSVNLIGRNGQIHDDKFADLTEGIGSIMPWASNKDANKISCFLAKWPITNGDAVAETVVLDTSGVSARVTGNVDLPGELLHLTVNTSAKKTSLASFAVPVRIKGSLLEPRIDVDPGEAVVGTVGNIVKAPAKLIAGLLSDTIGLVASEEALKEAADKNDPCLQALSGGKTTQTPANHTPSAEKKPDPKPTTPADNTKSTGDPLKDVEKVGEALKKLF